MYLIRNAVGRLVEARLGSPLTDADVQAVLQQLRLTVLSLPKLAVMFGDLRELIVLPPAWAEQFGALFTRDNPKVERTAFLVSQKHGSLGLQLGRLLRAANHPGRRSFETEAEVLEFLDPVLEPDERASLRAFLAATPGAPGP